MVHMHTCIELYVTYMYMYMYVHVHTCTCMCWSYPLCDGCCVELLDLLKLPLAGKDEAVEPTAWGGG